MAIPTEPIVTFVYVLNLPRSCCKQCGITHKNIPYSQMGHGGFSKRKSIINSALTRYIPLMRRQRFLHLPQNVQKEKDHMIVMQVQTYNLNSLRETIYQEQCPAYTVSLLDMLILPYIIDKVNSKNKKVRFFSKNFP